MPTPTDKEMLIRLRLDAGTRTFGELAQEREWAYREIEALRDRVARYATQPATALRGRPPGDKHEDPSQQPGPRYTGLRYLRLREVCGRVGLKACGIYRLMALGKFPKQVKLSERTAAWIESEVEAFMDARVAERDQLTSKPAPELSPYMRMGEVMRRTGLKSSELYDLIREGRFPKWAQLPKIASGWLRADVEAWIEARKK